MAIKPGVVIKQQKRVPLIVGSIVRESLEKIEIPNYIYCLIFDEYLIITDKLQVV